jgi:hypothetical protein
MRARAVDLAVDAGLAADRALVVEADAVAGAGAVDLAEEALGEVGAVLFGDAGDERCLHAWSSINRLAASRT